MQRREFLAGASALVGGAVAGCLGAQHEQAEDPWGQEQRDEGATSAQIMLDFELPEGTWAPYLLNADIDIQYEYAAEADAPIEGFLIDHAESDRLRNGDEVTQYQDFHDTGTRLSGQASVDGGQYWLALVNSAYGQQEPEGDASGTLEIVARF